MSYNTICDSISFPNRKLKKTTSSFMQVLLTCNFSTPDFFMNMKICAKSGSHCSNCTGILSQGGTGGFFGQQQQQQMCGPFSQQFPDGGFVCADFSTGSAGLQFGGGDGTANQQQQQQAVSTFGQQFYGNANSQNNSGFQQQQQNTFNNLNPQQQQQQQQPPPPHQPATSGSNKIRLFCSRLEEPKIIS